MTFSSINRLLRLKTKKDTKNELYMKKISEG